MIETQECPYATWRTLKLGTHKSVNDLSKALKDNGFRIGDNAADLLRKVVVLTTKTEIELVNVSVAELGFENSATRDEIYTRAHERGLDLVPADAGPQLRLQYTDQPTYEWVVMAMEPMAGSSGSLSLFCVERSGTFPWLRARYSGPDHLWGGRASLGVFPPQTKIMSWTIDPAVRMILFPRFH